MLTYNNGNNSPEALPTDRKSPILDMLTDALDDEYSDYTKYMELSEKIDDTRDSGTVRSMAYDEYKHRRLFEEIYKALTGSAPAEKNMSEETSGAGQSQSLRELLTESLFEELDSVEFYRDIMSNVETPSVREILFEIITDEQSHAHIINYLLFKYCLEKQQ